MLTDEEKRAIRAKVKEASGEWHFDLMMYANEIERAVLAKAGEQEPAFAFMGGYTMIEGKKYYELTVNYKFKDNLPKGNFYILPLPAQAIPEITDDMRDAGGEALYGISRERAIEIAKEDKFDSYADQAVCAFEAMLSASPKP